MSALTAIETTYAGCRFRSRLEARWAVFFDKLGIKWLYEPQGYVLGNGDRYLPDFWLPDEAMWVEVKGVANEAAWIKLYAATAADGLPLQYENGLTPAVVLGQDVNRMPTLNRVLVLGEIPHPKLHGWGHIVTVPDSAWP